METKNLIIAFVWIFVLIISVAVFWVRGSYVFGIGGPFLASFILFLIAIGYSFVVLKKG